MDEAEHLFRSVLQIEPNNVRANVDLGLLELRQGKANEGFAHLDAALKATPSDGNLWLLYASALLEAGRPADARTLLENGMQQYTLPEEGVVHRYAEINRQLQIRAAYPTRPVPLPDVRDQDFYEILEKAWPFSMAGVLGHVDVFYSLYEIIKFVVKHDIPGDFVECGVNAGGLSLLAALTFVKLGDTSRSLYLYDTFEGMPPPTREDGPKAEQDYRARTENGKAWAKVDVDTVRQTMRASGYPDDKIHLVKGLVEDTIPQVTPEKISVLRLDTDYYSSTKHELIHLYPILSEFGSLIVDDYGYYRGSRLATDEYIAESGARILLQRLNYSVRVGGKS